MDFGAYIVLLVTGKNFLQPHEIPFTDRYLNTDETTGEAVTIDGLGYLSAICR